MDRIRGSFLRFARDVDICAGQVVGVGVGILHLPNGLGDNRLARRTAVDRTLSKRGDDRLCRRPQREAQQQNCQDKFHWKTLSSIEVCPIASLPEPPAVTVRA